MTDDLEADVSIIEQTVRDVSKARLVRGFCLSTRGLHETLHKADMATLLRNEHATDDQALEFPAACGLEVPLTALCQLQAEASWDTSDTEPDPVNYTEVPVRASDSVHAFHRFFSRAVAEARDKLWLKRTAHVAVFFFVSVRFRKALLAGQNPRAPSRTRKL